MLNRLAQPLKFAIAREITTMFADPGGSQRPVARSADSLFGPRSVAWRVHGDVATMMAGGLAGLLLQMLHPAVLAGVWDHSGFRADMHGRLRRTARFIALTTYGPRDDAEAAIARVRRIHTGVRKQLPGGQPYRADDPALLAWVHATEAVSFLDARIRYAEPFMALAEQDRYFAEMAEIGGQLGADPLPRTRRAAERLIATVRAELDCDARTREVARLVFSQRAVRASGEPMRRLLVGAAIDLLPRWAREMHGIASPGLALPLIRTGTIGLAHMLRWALAPPAGAAICPPTPKVAAVVAALQ